MQTTKYHSRFIYLENIFQGKIAYHNIESFQLQSIVFMAQNISETEQSSSVEGLPPKTDNQHFIGHYSVAPQYMKDNDHITHGYRINFNTPRKIIRSLFMVHNESVNIWSHCLPAVILIGLLVSLYALLSAQAMSKTFYQCQTQIKKTVDIYTETLNNLTLLADYDTFSTKTKSELQQFKQTILHNYQEFTGKMKESSAQMQTIILEQAATIKTNVKEIISQNINKFEMMKIQFEETLAPMLVEELNHKLDSSWTIQLKKAVAGLKQSIDSQNFQYIELYQHLPNPYDVSRWPIFVFLASAAICLLFSTCFHLFYPMSSRTYTITNRFDYAGVNLLITGSTVPPFYYGMYCHFAVAILYMTCTIVIAVTIFIVCLFQWVHRPENIKYKALFFGGFGLINLIPFAHLLINEFIFDNYGDPYQFSPSFPYFLLLGASYLTGLYVYSIRCPERNNPGKYNLCGNSHQIWHAMTVLGIIFTYLGALKSFEMRKTSQCPS